MAIYLQEQVSHEIKCTPPCLAARWNQNHLCQINLILEMLESTHGFDFSTILLNAKNATGEKPTGP